MKIKFKIMPKAAAIVAALIVSGGMPIAITAGIAQLSDIVHGNQGSVRALVTNPYHLMYLSGLGIASAFAAEMAAQSALNRVTQAAVAQQSKKDGKA
ncbi:MAG: hypothetical protein AAGB19_01145 [Cyanobacteria bacterium P01_F01_bin.3]